ncbi:hypothetical protein NDU88_003333 [Pleurodeles waltl]|uniref:Uncharacterized protein n=1 Tax=Pleurodeles waltl TaxID=8319 RepID=A0AAV7W383_PLEWA|nr:hypothetical protein NDU88_003333 [Pleurodeles waltl]
MRQRAHVRKCVREASPRQQRQKTGSALRNGLLRQRAHLRKCVREEEVEIPVRLKKNHCVDELFEPADVIKQKSCFGINK